MAIQDENFDHLSLEHIEKIRTRLLKNLEKAREQVRICQHEVHLFKRKVINRKNKDASRERQEKIPTQ